MQILINFMSFESKRYITITSNQLSNVTFKNIYHYSEIKITTTIQ